METAIQAGTTETDLQEHQRTYRKFVRFARLAALATPFFVAFIIYWTQ